MTFSLQCDLARKTFRKDDCFESQGTRTRAKGSPGRLVCICKASATLQPTSGCTGTCPGTKRARPYTAVSVKTAHPIGFVTGTERPRLKKNQYGYNNHSFSAGWLQDGKAKAVCENLRKAPIVCPRHSGHCLST